MALHYIRKGDYWAVLSLPGYPRSLANLPTWVPDWSVDAQPQPEPEEFDSNMYQGVLGSNLFALGEEQYQPRISSFLKTLIRKGILITTIIHTAEQANRDHKFLNLGQRQHIIDFWMMDELAVVEAKLAAGK